MADTIPVQLAAENLIFYTLGITDNINNFPKKYRYTIVDRLIKLTMNIHDEICDANNSYDKEERVKHIEQAISECRKTTFYVKLTYRKFHPECSVSYWDGMVQNIEEQLQNWRTDTKKRIKQKK